MTKPKTVDDYIAGFPDEVRERLDELRRVSQRAAPGAAEGLKWGDPAYIHERGTILFMFSGHKAHANFVFTPSTREAFAAELTEYRTGKGSVALPYDAPVPTDLLTRMVKYRIGEYEADGVNWM